MNNTELQSFEIKRELMSREKMLSMLAQYIEIQVSTPCTCKDLDGIEKLMRLYFEQLDRMNP